MLILSTKRISRAARALEIKNGLIPYWKTTIWDDFYDSLNVISVKK